MSAYLLFDYLQYYRCSRLGLSALAYLWRRDQTELLGEMISSGIEAVLIKVAAMGIQACYFSIKLKY